MFLQTAFCQFVSQCFAARQKQVAGLAEIASVPRVGNVVERTVADKIGDFEDFVRVAAIALR